MENYGGKKNTRGAGAGLYITLGAAFLLLALFLAMALFFKITDITVEGSKRYTAQQIVDASGVEPDGSVFFLDTSKAQIAIKDALPYVDTVKISRRLPGTVVITVTESVGEAYFAAEGAYWIVDISGRILERADAAPSGLTELRGFTAVDPREGKKLSLGAGESVRQSALLDTLAALKDGDMLALTAYLDVTNLSAVLFEYNGYNVNFGEANEFDKKFSILIDQIFVRYTEKGSGQSFIYQNNDSFRYSP